MKQICLTIALLLLAATVVLAQAPVKRAKLPDFPLNAGAGIFFDNVFEEGLQGPRPANLGQPPPAVAATSGGPSAPAPSGGASDQSSGGEGLYPWAKIISATSIEDEVKSLKADTDQNVTTPTKFAGGDYRIVRRDFSILAMLFAITAEYDGEVRWKESAAAARDMFAGTARNAKVGTQPVYNEAKLRRDQLGDLLNGSRIDSPAATVPKADWGKIVDRPPLMQKLEMAYQGKVLPWTSSAGAFKENEAELKRQAELVASIGEVLKQEGMYDAGDPDYDGYSDAMKSAALEIVQAIKDGDQEAAAKAAGQIGQACSSCHELYRG